MERFLQILRNLPKLQLFPFAMRRSGEHTIAKNQRLAALPHARATGGWRHRFMGSNEQSLNWMFVGQVVSNCEMSDHDDFYTV